MTISRDLLDEARKYPALPGWQPSAAGCRRYRRSVNPAHGLLAPLRERAAPDLMPAFLVPLTRQDWPTAAVIDLSRVRSLNPESVAGPAGQLTPATLNTLATAVRSYLGATD